MKTSALLAMLMVVASYSFANTLTNSDLAKCRDYSPNVLKGLSTTSLVEHDLVNGMWTSTNKNGIEKTYQFTSEGLLQMLSTDKKGYKSYQSIFWRIDEFDAKPFLILSNENGTEKLMRINQTCEGLLLTDMVCEEIVSLNYQPLRASKRFNLTRAYLVGEWTNVSMFDSSKGNEQLNGSFFGYQFFANGTFVCEYGNAKSSVTENGVWEISKDCQFLLLHASDENDETDIKATKVIRIAQVDDHGLILEQIMKSSDVNDFFNANNKTYAFIK